MLDALLALMVVKTAMQVGLPNDVKAKMMMNIIIDFLIGLVPVLGDIADVMYKANTRNAALLESYLREKGKKELRKSGIPLGIDPSLPENYVEDEEPGREDQMTMPARNKSYLGRSDQPDEEARIGSRQNSHHTPQRPAQAALGQGSRQNSSHQKPSTSRQHSSRR